MLELHECATHRHPFFTGLRHLSRSHWGMVLGHLGVGVTVIGIAFSTQYSVERDVRMKAGDSVDIHHYHFVFRGVQNLQGPQLQRRGAGVIDVTRNGKPEATLQAEKRFYTAARTMMTEAAIEGGFSLWATIDTLQFDSLAQEQQYRDLTAALPEMPEQQHRRL